VSSAVGDTALLTWTCGGTSVKDWIGLYPSSATPDTGEVLWRYTGGNAAAGKIGVVVPLDTPTGSTYEWRLFSNDGYTRIASAPMQVVNPSTGMQLVPSTAPRGSTVQVRWTNIPNPERHDWIGLYPTTSTPKDEFVAWQYTDMNRPAAEMPFVLPSTLTPGTYNLRMYADDTYTQIGAASVTVTTDGGGGGSCEWPAATPPLPSSVLNLTNWKLTVPVDKCDDNQWADEISQPALSSFEDENSFHVNASGDGVAFRARVDGARTSENTNYPRSELREMTNNGSSQARWSNKTSSDGVHAMHVDAAITSVPPNKPQVVAAQIHDGSDDVIMIRLNGSKLIVDADDSATQLVLDENYVLGTRFTVDITAVDGNIRVVYNGARTVDYASSGDTWFFKAGCYTLSNTSFDRADAYGEVVLYGLTVAHS
jgi:poly(beta-D-mannuronate) lyase